MMLRAIAAGAVALALSVTAVLAQGSQGSSPLSGRKGGTNNSFMQFTGPATSIKTYTLPNADHTIATLTATQTLTNKTFDCNNNICTVRIASDVTGLGSGVAALLGAFSSANLRTALTDEVGTGAAYFVGGALGTPASAILTNATGLPLSGLASQAAWSFVVNNTSGSAAPTAVDIASLTTKASPAAGDYVVLSDQSASGALKKATVSSVGSAGSVSSIAGNTGAFTLGIGLTNSTNEIRFNSGTVIGSTQGTYATNATLATTLPADDSIPQSGEGTQIISVSYTPRSASSTLRVRFSGQISCASIDNAVAAMFNGASNAFSAQLTTVAVANAFNPIAFEGSYAPGSTSAQTISLRVGCNASSSAMNGFPSTRRLGGVSIATLTVEEIAP